MLSKMASNFFTKKAKNDKFEMDGEEHGRRKRDINSTRKVNNIRLQKTDPSWEKSQSIVLEPSVAEKDSSSPEDSPKSKSRRGRGRKSLNSKKLSEISQVNSFFAYRQ